MNWDNCWVVFVYQTKSWSVYTDNNQVSVHRQQSGICSQTTILTLYSDTNLNSVLWQHYGLCALTLFWTLYNDSNMDSVHWQHSWLCKLCWQPQEDGFLFWDIPTRKENILERKYTGTNNNSRSSRPAIIRLCIRITENDQS